MGWIIGGAIVVVASILFVAAMIGKENDMPNATNQYQPCIGRLICMACSYKNGIEGPPHPRYVEFCSSHGHPSGPHLHRICPSCGCVEFGPLHSNVSRQVS